MEPKQNKTTFYIDDVKPGVVFIIVLILYTKSINLLTIYNIKIVNKIKFL